MSNINLLKVSLKNISLIL